MQQGARNMFKKALLVSVITILGVLPATASRYCSEPSTPFCLSMLGMGHDNLTFQMCRSSMESYKREVEEYKSCLFDEGKDAIDDYNKAVRKFNCYASGQTFCL
jgi:hypothetical protein